MNIPSIIGVSIPVIAIILGIGIVVLAMYFDFRRKRELIQLYHAERMAAIEKGIELPPLSEQYFTVGGDAAPSGPAKARRTGLILVFLGGAITLSLWGSGILGNFWWWGIVPLALGVAFLLTALFEAREQRQSAGQGAVRPDSDPNVRD